MARKQWAELTIAVLTFCATGIERAAAHDKSCEGDAVPRGIKLDCCSKADEHQLQPEQITRGQNGEYIVRFEAYTFVIPETKALPSNDRCSHIFFETLWIVGEGGQRRLPATPEVFCFLTPLAF
jgi:hypothetical protein